MNVRGALDAVETRLSRNGPHADRFLRIGLAAWMLLTGTHLFLNPAAWHRYLAPPVASAWPTTLLPLDPVFSLLGAVEVLVGLLVLADWHTPTLATLSGIYLLGIVANLGLAILAGEPYGDIMLRDFGLALFALGTALETAQDTSAGTPRDPPSAD